MLTAGTLQPVRQLRTPDLRIIHDTIPLQTMLTAGTLQPDSGESSSWVNGKQQFRKQRNDTYSQSEVIYLAECMPSVGAIIGNGTRGTAFRVGKIYVMTAWHVVKDIVDVNGVLNYHNLEKTEVFINFNEDLEAYQTKVYHVKRCWEDPALDVAVLEISDPDADLPKPLILLNNTLFNNSDNVSLIGYGMPGSCIKTLDPNCKRVHNVNNAVSEAQAWINNTKTTFITALKVQGINPDNLDWTYKDSGKQSDLVIHCFMMHGASGAPMLVHTREIPLQVIGLLTHALPKGVWELPAAIRERFPLQHRIEMGPKMSYVFKSLGYSNRADLQQDIFGK